MSEQSWFGKLWESVKSAVDASSRGCERLIEKRPRLLLVLLTLIWLVPGSDTLPLVDRDEPRFAYATQEMLQNQAEGEPAAWAVPYFNEQYRFDKPPLVYWWMGAHYMLGGYNDFTARLHSIVATALVVLLMFGFGSRLYDRKVGFWAAFAFLTCVQVLQHGRLCVADMPMMVFMVAALWAGWELFHKASWKWAAVFWLSLALGFSTKWIVPWAAVGVTLGAFTVWEKRWPPLANYKPITGALVMLGLIAAWAVPAYYATDGAFFDVGLGEHVIERGAEAMNSRHYNPVFYLLTALVSLMPWLGSFGGVFGALKQNPLGSREKFLLSGLVGIYVLFSVAQTQLPHYVMPAFPLFFILLAGTTNLLKPKGRFAKGFFWGFYGVWDLLLLVALIVVLAVPVSAETMPLKVAAVLLVLSISALLYVGFARAHNKTSLALLLMVVSALCFGGAASNLRDTAVTRQVAALLGRVDTDRDLIAHGFEEPGLTAYTKHTWNYSPRFDEAIEAYNKADKATLLVLAREISLDSLGDALLNKPLEAERDNDAKLLENPPQGGSRLRLEGLNLGRFSWIVYELYQKP